MVPTTRFFEKKNGLLARGGLAPGLAPSPCDQCPRVCRPSSSDWFIGGEGGGGGGKALFASIVIGGIITALWSGFYDTQLKTILSTFQSILFFKLF